MSLVQFASAWLDRDANIVRMRQWAEREATEGAELIVFPETANTGYVIYDGSLWNDGRPLTRSEFSASYVAASEPIPGPTTDALLEVARRHDVFIVVGLSQTHPLIPASLYNSAVLIGPSGIVGVHHKSHFGADDNRYFYPGTTRDVYTTPLGNIGMMVCADRRYPELARVLALRGAEIICVPTANAPSYHEYWTEQHAADMIRAVAQVRAHENGVYLLTCNRSGDEGKLHYHGHSLVTAPDGRVLAELDSDDESALRADLLNDELVQLRANRPIFRSRRPDLYGDLVRPLSDVQRGGSGRVRDD